MLKIYLAHQITGLTPDEVMGYYDGITSHLAAFFDILSPMTGKREYFRTHDPFVPGGYVLPIATNHAIFERDMWMVSQADIVFVDFTGTTDKSIGMISELATASALKKHTVIVLPPGNIHEHAFVTEAADIVFQKFRDAIGYLEELSMSIMAIHK
jgi:nucleoside 2-deoxyribosyltransferase